MPSTSAPDSANGRFPETQRSAIIRAGSADEAVRRQGHEVIIAAYWKPVYKYLRMRWPQLHETAQDQTQGFFALAIEKRFFEDYDVTKGTFRTYLRTCVDRFMANDNKRAHRFKRGGDTRVLPLDFQTAEGELRQHEIAVDQNLDELFHQEWVRSVFELAIADLRSMYEARGKQLVFRVFERYDLCDRESRPTYADLAEEFGVNTVTLTNYLAGARRDFRRSVLNKLREITVSEREFRSEARAVLGIDV